MKRVRFNFSRNFIIWILFTYLLPRNGLRIPHPWIIDPFSFVSVSLVLVLSISRLDSMIERYAPASVRSEWMDERREGKKEEKKFESTVYPVPFDASTCRIRFTRGVSILLCVASRTQSSPPRDTIAIFQPSNNLSFVQRTIDTDEHGISPHGIFGSTVKIVDKPVTLRSLS